MNVESAEKQVIAVPAPADARGVVPAPLPPQSLPQSTEARGPELTTLQTPFCGELRSKKFFMLDTLATEEGQYLDASNHCWCFQTQQVIGPDSAPVSPRQCAPGRACYTSGLNELS